MSGDGLADLVGVLAGRRLVVLTGAGCSTESGIPDYRGPGTAARARSPIEYRAFVGQEAARRRYWARSFVGWPRMRRSLPNAGHLALAALEHAGMVVGLVTQNVDGLHGVAGSSRVIELHGALDRVVCLGCRATSARADMQERLARLNPELANASPLEVAPDGDAAVEIDLERFVVPACEACGGVLKPDVVFFGEAVPRERVAATEAWIAEAQALLVVGSSLAVYSGLRVVKGARARGLPCALVNLGPPMRGAEYFVTHADRAAGALLPRLAAMLGAPASCTSPLEA